MPDEEDAAQAAEPSQERTHKHSRSTRFRFKSKRKHREDDDISGGSHRSSRKRHRHEEEERYRRHDKYRSRRQSPSPGVRDEPLDPDAAFRESLFDALADDEGAAYWEGVYGQPIHIYPNAKSSNGDGADGTQGELEQMDEEEYAAYVRSRMWEKSHQHVIEERQRREEQRRRNREQTQAEREQSRSNARAFDNMIEAALRRGQMRKSQKSWEQAWKEYVGKWERLIEVSKQRAAKSASAAEDAKDSEFSIPWPVNSGRREDVDKESVRAFFLTHDKSELPRLLKVERVQWHPDKMQQRLGAQKLDDATMQSVTAVFQIVDDLWAEIKQA